MATPRPFAAYEFLIAWRYLRAKRAEGGVSVMTWISLIGITLAVAGFADEDLAITVEDRQLVIRGRQESDDDGRVFLHRGIAARQFQRSFVLADGVEVAGADLENGLLHVDLERSEPEAVIQKVQIGKRG